MRKPHFALTTTRAADALCLPDVVIRLEAGHGDADTLIFLHHRLGCLLSFLEFNDLL